MSKNKKPVFIIHNVEKGRKYADLLALFLRRDNIATIYGEGLVGSVPDKIRELIEKSSLAVAVLTPDVELAGGQYQPSQWPTKEVVWAVANRVPVIITAEEGVEFAGDIAGELEQIRFAPGDFGSVLERVGNQVKALLGDLITPPDLPEDHLSDPVWRLIMTARKEADKGNNENFLRLSEMALELDRKAWRAALNKGLALGKLGRFRDAKRVLLEIAKTFKADPLAKTWAYHNLGWLEQVRSAGNPWNVEALRAEGGFYEAALAALHSNIQSRVSLIQCKVLLGEISEASALLMQSINYRGFPAELRYETEQRGHLGHQILRELPESVWLYPILFPVWPAARDESWEEYQTDLNLRYMKGNDDEKE